MIIARNSITLHHVRDIASSTWYYKLQASTASPPAKPTTATPSGWSTTEPTYTEGSTNSLYTVQETTFSDGTFEYSDVSLSSSYEAAKAAYNKSVQALDAVTPIAAKTYTDLIGSANDAANASFYFAKVHPINYTVQWSVSLRFHVTAPEAYAQDVTIRFGGYGSSFSSYDSYTVRTGSIGMYYVNLYRATKAGIETNHKGHALGIGLRSSTNPTNTSYKRTITVELLEVENCTVDMLDTAVKYADIDGTGGTNYSGLTEMAVGTAGQNATNNTNTSYQQHGSAVKVGANGVRSYSLIMKDTDSTWSSLFGSAYNGTATGKTVCTSGFLPGSILYSAGAPSGGNYAAGANTSTVYDGYPLDFRYSSNCASTLVSYKPVYLVGEMHDDGLFYLDETWWTQTVPTAEDGKTYVYVGEAYSSYQVWLSVENPAYQFYEGKFRKLSEVEEIKAARTATNYLASDTTGIMVANLADGHTYTPSTVPNGIMNAFISSDKFQVRDGKAVLATYGTEAAIYTTDGTELAHFGYASGTSASGGTSVTPYYTLGRRASGSSIGNWSFAAGFNSEASGGISTALGAWTVASGNYSFAAGSTCEASGDVSVAMGGFSKAEAQYSAAMGCGAEAKEFASMAVGYYTVANDSGQFACGSCNTVDTNKEYAVVVGGGSSPETPLTIHGLTWDGDPKYYVGGNIQKDTDITTALQALGWDGDVVSNNMFSLKTLLGRLLQRLSPVSLYNMEINGSATAGDYNTVLLYDIAKYNALIMRCTCGRARQMLVFLRAEGNNSMTMTDYNPTTGKSYRADFKVDWTNTAVSICWREGGQYDSSIWHIYGML